MVKIKILTDDFMSGITHIPKGEIIEVPQIIGDHIVANDQGKIIKPRKSTYKTRVVKADV